MGEPGDGGVDLHERGRQVDAAEPLVDLFDVEPAEPAGAARTISSGIGVSRLSTASGMPSSASARDSTTTTCTGSKAKAEANAWPT